MNVPGRIVYLPNRDNAFVTSAKVTSYLLSENHPTGHSKARFFRLMGFDEDSAPQLLKGLLKIARRDSVVETEDTEHGVKYVVEGVLETPTRRKIYIRTVWIIDTGQEAPRFVTAYPR